MSQDEQSGSRVPERESGPTSAAIHPFPRRDMSSAVESHKTEPHKAPAAAPPVVSFDRLELREILNLYGRRVAEGEWKDYAISFTTHKATFSVYRRASEVPLYRIEKDPTLARKQGAYSVVTATGLILKRGQDLAKVISVIDKRPKLVVI
ncbi:DUF2794 domain-containing protein [Lichenihabitans psoromatis]|uniref:DUF2794 domain-containing protein n=1 Tax=Lichenihabitans psoromatis TaxID=2528642 RepID=UPI003CCA873D